MSVTEQEVGSQPDCWVQAVSKAGGAASALPRAGERIAVVGCGTSLFIARAYASMRESAGAGHSDAFPASEFPSTRSYDRIVAISRSGTTTEVIRLLQRFADTPTVAVSAVAGSLVAKVANQAVILDFADESSVVQTRFATSALALLRTHLGHDLSTTIEAARRALAEPPDDLSDFDRFVFLGHGWSVGIAEEAALKIREAARADSEAYPAMEYRHGPISLADPRTLVWILASPDPGVARDVRSTGASLIVAEADPMVELVRIHRAVVALALARGFDPDRPRNLTRSVVLS